MFVESIANRYAVVPAETPLSQVMVRLKEYPALMVIQGATVSGAVARGSLLAGFADHWLNHGPASQEIMDRPVAEFVRPTHVVPFGTPVEDAIDLLVGGESAVVVEDRRGQPYGLISWLEINQYLREITGLHDRESVRFSLALLDMPGQLARVAEVVGRSGANINAITLSDPKVLNWVHVVVRVDREHAGIARGALQKAGIDIISEHHPRQTSPE